MASLSLPRVLQPRKTILDAERENFEKCQAVSISKAVNLVECPVKEKHVRATIIGTFHSQGGQAFWSIATKQPIQEHRIVAWKFCHVLHKVLREGHGLCVQHSLRHRGMLEDVGKLWGHLKEGYGKLIQTYCKLLVTKLNFHNRNPRFPGNLVLTREELESIGENDINVYFQLSVEMFDYMDDLLLLQQAIFNSLDACRTNSMTSSGQCRLAPLIPCIQDSNQLYDFSVKILFKLHSALPPDTLSGHRERFLKQFKELKLFYNNTRQLQYFINLIKIPKLPERPPNFLIQAELRAYIPPVVILPEQPPDDISNSLVDTSDVGDLVSVEEQNNQAAPQIEPGPDLSDLIRERDMLINHLQGEVSRLQLTIQRLVAEHQSETAKLREEVNALETLVTLKISELAEEHKLKEQAQEQAIFAMASAPQLEHKLSLAEEKIKSADEKFQKLKTLYTDTRNEHVQLLRQKAEVDKQLSAVTKAKSEIELAKANIQVRLDELIEDQSTTTALKETQQEILELRDQITKLQSQNTELESSHTQLIVAKENIELSLTKQNENLQNKSEQVQASLEAKISELSLEKSRIQETSQQSATEKQKEVQELTEQIQSLHVKLNELEQACEQKKIEQEIEITQLQEQFENERGEKMMLSAKVDWITNEKNIVEGELIDIVSQREELDVRLKEYMDIYEQVKLTVQDEQANHTAEIANMFQNIVVGSIDVLKMALHEVDNPAMSAVTCTPDYFKSVSDATISSIDLMMNQYCKFTEDKQHLEEYSKSIILSSHLLSNVILQGKATSNTSPDIEFGERLADEVKQFGQHSTTLFESLIHLGDPRQVSDSVIVQLRSLCKLVEGLASPGQSSEALGDMVEGELASMDKAIEEAALKIEEMLSKSRAADSGIKLEVNEKILDACTNLMKAIRLLVQKARTLQAEIVAAGKGTASAKEFYKRNHQWTEGLISAAKAVALGAQLLLTSADKVVSGNGKLEMLMVASQEIAASTAQLVVASRVKAQRGSSNLSALGSASKGVTQATGTVLATAKACAQMVEESQDLDMSGLTVHQAKRLEMESQVRLLELEQALQVERARLSSLRRKHYQLEDDGDR